MRSRTFKLTVAVRTAGAPGSYWIAAESDIQGEADATVSFDPAAAGLETVSELLRRRVSLRELQALGGRLCDVLFAGPVRHLLDATLGQVFGQEELILRLILRIDPPELAVLPWEILYLAERELFLAASAKVTLSRTLSVLQPIRSILLPEEIRALLLVPATSELITESEVQELQRRLERAARVEIVRPATRQGIREALRTADVHLVHYAGHGSFRKEEAILYLDGAEGLPDPTPGAAFAELFRDLPSLRLLVLSSCEGASRSSARALAGAAPQLLQRGIPAVIAMQSAIRSSAAAAFTAAFYAELIGGRQSGNVEVALGLARKALLEDRFRGPSLVSPLFASPVLYQRSEGGELWQSPTSQAVTGPMSGPAPGLFLPRVGLPPAEDLDVYRLLHWESGLAEQLVGRDSQRAELLEWAQTTSNPERPRILFLTGLGGSGKTRLAFEVAHALRGMGWTAGFAPSGFDRIPPVRTRGLFLVVDYPEERRDEVVRMWLSLSALSDSAVPIRILLLSRQGSIDDWDLELSEGHARKFLSRRPLETGALAPDEAQRLFESACHRLAAHLGVAPPDLAWTEIGPWLESDPDLHALPLFALAAAVHVVLMKRPLSALSVREVLEALVEREVDRMRNTAHGAGLDRRAAERLSALSALSGGLDVATLRQLAEPSVGLKLPAPDLVLHHVDRLPWWQHAHWASPQPDVLAAVHTWMTLGRDQRKGHAVSEWIWTALYGAAPPDRPETRDASWARQVDRVLYDILRIEGAGAYDEARSWWPGMLRGDQVRARALEPLLSMLPVPSTLTGLSIAVAEVLRARRPAGSPAAAQLANRVSLQWAEEGRFAEAVAEATEAVRFYEEVVSAEPGRYEEELASARLNQSIWLNKVGRTEEALTAGAQAVDGYRRLADREPRRYTAGLAQALNNLSNRFSEAGRADEALTTIRESVGVLRGIAQHDTGTHEPGLARALTNLSSHLSAKGRYDEALRATQEAIDIRRHLAQKEPSLYDTELAITLNNAANLLGTLDRPGEAVELLREAITIHERLVTARSVLYEPALAHNLNNLSVHLWAVGRRRESLDAIERAAGIYRRLAATFPERHELNLARALSNLSAQQRALGDTSAALSSLEEAVATYRRLAARNPAAHEPELATVLDGQQNLLGEVGRPEEAVAAGEEAEAILRRLAGASPDRYAVAHARTLSNLSLVLAATEQAARALAATDEAVAIARHLAIAHPERYASELAQGLNNRLLRLIDAGRSAEAVSAGREAVAIRRTQSARLRDRFEPDLARALCNLSLALAADGLPLDAAVAAEEASHIYRRLHREEPRAWARRLSNTLSVLGMHQLQAGMAAAAAATLDEGRPLSRALAQENPGAYAELHKTLLRRSIEALTRAGDEARRAAVEAELASWTPSS